MISNLTAHTIYCRDDIKVDAGGPAKASSEHPEWEGKYAGWIYFIEDDRFHPLINTEPKYDTPQAAKKAMRDMLKEIRQRAKETLEKGSDGRQGQKDS